MRKGAAPRRNSVGLAGAGRWLLVSAGDLAGPVGRSETFANGLAPVINALRQPEVIFAFQLTLSAAFWAVVINTIFGVGISLLLVRYTFPGKAGAERPRGPAAGGLARRRRAVAGTGLQRPHRLAGRASSRLACRSSMRHPASSWQPRSSACRW